jgi:hypothetical protein
MNRLVALNVTVGPPRSVTVIVPVPMTAVRVGARPDRLLTNRLEPLRM